MALFRSQVGPARLLAASSVWIAASVCAVAGCFYGHPLTGLLPEDSAGEDQAALFGLLLGSAGAAAPGQGAAEEPEPGGGGVPGALALSYPAAPTLIRAQMMTRLTPTPPEGAITNCSIDPALPTGLLFTAFDCSISGTPAGGSSATTHTVIAQLDTGATATAELALQVEGDFRYIYVTANLYDGDSLGGVSGADAICNSDSGLFPAGASFRALLGAVNGAPRHACTGAGQGGCPSGGATANWSLAANTEYRRIDGTTIIGTTNANRIILLPMTNSIAGVGGSAWSGMEVNWNTVGATSECGGWNGPGNGNLFVLNNASATNAGSLACGLPAALVCVEQ